MIFWIFISPNSCFTHSGSSNTAGLSTNLNPYYNSTNYPESNLVKNYCRNPFDVIISEWPNGHMSVTLEFHQWEQGAHNSQCLQLKSIEISDVALVFHIRFVEQSGNVDLSKKNPITFLRSVDFPLLRSSHLRNFFALRWRTSTRPGQFGVTPPTQRFDGRTGWPPEKAGKLFLPWGDSISCRTYMDIYHHISYGLPVFQMTSHGDKKIDMGIWEDDVLNC